MLINRASLENDKRSLSDKISKLTQQLSESTKATDAAKQTADAAKQASEAAKRAEVAAKKDAERLSKLLLPSEQRSAEVMTQLEGAEQALRESQATATKLLQVSPQHLPVERLIMATLCMTLCDCCCSSLYADYRPASECTAALFLHLTCGGFQLIFACFSW